MFTAEQIQAAHSKVRSGVDFPSYIREIKVMGVTHYESYVTDGHIDYHGANDLTVTVSAKYGQLAIAGLTNPQQFKTSLRAHRQGKTDYLTFCRDCAKSGIEKWMVDLEKMTCTYYDNAGKEILVEKIPH